MKTESRGPLPKFASLMLCLLLLLAAAGCRVSMEAGHHLDDRNAAAYERLRPGEERGGSTPGPEEAQEPVPAG